MTRALLALLCALACTLPGAGLAQSKKDNAAAAPPPAVPEKLAPADVDALLSQLTDAQARQLLAQVNGVMVEPTMRARTLLPLARKFLVVVLVVMTMMLLLSAIGDRCEHRAAAGRRRRHRPGDRLRRADPGARHHHRRVPAAGRRVPRR